MVKAQPTLFRVMWGSPFKNFEQELVMAFDCDEALILAAELRPDLPRPRVAFIVSIQ